MKENGIDLDKLERPDRKKCKRSYTVIIVKNIPYTTKQEDLKEVFERYGVLKRVLLSPFNTLGIVEYENEKQAKAAMKNLAYHKINYIMPIYLEYAPIVISKSSALTKEDL
jgi:multiple RNA-binding domain-containing protein 1